MAGLLGSGVLIAADVSTVIPYAGILSYDSDGAKSLKDDAKIGGFYSSVGNLDYLLEFAYGYTDITYKDKTVENIKQHDITVKYAKYYQNYTWNAGLHYINNNEKDTLKDLGNGYIAIAGLDGYKWFGYNKLTYGVSMYYAYYNAAYNDTSLVSTKNIKVLQISPKIIYSKMINFNTRNTISLMANFIKANDYQDSDYNSYEISDTIGYKSFYATFKYNGGEMRSGVKDGGFTVFNNKDLFKRAYSAKFGYYFTPTLEADISYTKNNYQEYDSENLRLLPEGSNRVIVFSMHYSY